MHRNSNQNQDPHHLYEVWDNQEEEVFKFGISSEPIEEEKGRLPRGNLKRNRKK